MKTCPNCGAQIEDSAAFCFNCGASFTPGANDAPAAGAAAPNAAPAQPVPPVAGQAPQYQQQQYYAAPDFSDHTAEFDPKDISDNKVMAMLPYLLGTVGIIIAMLGSKESPYTKFHVYQALKLTVCGVLIGIVSLVLCWTFIVPIAGGICETIVFVLRIIAFFQICGGKAKEPGIVKNLRFLK